MHTRWATGAGRPGDDRIFAAARVLGFEAGAEPMSRANAEGVADVGAARPRWHNARRAKICRSRGRRSRASLK